MLNESRHYKWREFRLATQSRRFFFTDIEIDLTRMEFALVCTMIESPQQVFSRIQILQVMEVAAGYGAEAIVDSHIARIRRKVRLAGGPKIFKAVHGIGFRLEQ